MPEIKAICVFCGASRDVPLTHLEAGAAFGAMLAKRNIELIYGAGNSGIMGRVANGALNEGGRVTGVFPRSLKNLELEHHRLSEFIEVETMHERKRIMFERCDALVILPGGFGTMDEMFEIITWKQLGFHHKPIVIVNHQGYWNPLIALMDTIIQTGFARGETRALYRVVDTLEEVFAAVNEA